MSSVDVRIEVPGERDIAAVVDFVMQARARIFPMLADAPMPADLADFAGHYLMPGAGRFLIAREGGRIVAAIGYLHYDHRFAQLDYRGRRVVEVVRLFVEPEYRRGGLGRRLYEALQDMAREDGVEVLYLHTHPFLPGAIAFWERLGFVVVDVEDDPVWRTTHMQKPITNLV
ncbi:MAG: GNAT family N-acetyltransferase [Paucimonas sp.]|jgi:GNAT superfamily N-acetyltransferase|nr:GNAT family N-acetyltransferase [Paucimonas sp.]